jgi:hypothetical protein
MSLMATAKFTRFHVSFQVRHCDFFIFTLLHFQVPILKIEEAALGTDPLYNKSNIGSKER